MKFIDQAVVYVSSGKGGAGSVSFRREKYVPRGGPDGGDGGDGGSVIFSATSQKDTLFHFRMNQHLRAENGRPGMGANRHGKSGLDLLADVPVGTMIYDADTDELLADLAEAGRIYIAAQGGRGGRGNARFATATNRAPRYAQPGEPAESRRIRMELKLLADVGLVGLPNAGKSTLISVMSAAKPKIAEYPFTTLAPILGVVAISDEESFVIADIPGLIEGASGGAGLGHQFLRHIQRCRVLFHLLDAGRIDPADPLKDFLAIEAELEAFDPRLMEKQRIVGLSKMDLTGAEDALTAVRQALPDVEVLPFSAATGQGLAEVKYTLYRLVKKPLEEPEIMDEYPEDEEPEDAT